MKKIISIIILFLSLSFLVQCSQFQDIFNTTGQTSQRVSQKQNKDLSGHEDPTSNVREPIVTKKGIYYFVVSGDTLNGIAKRFKIHPEDLAQINDLFDSNLVIGRRLFIPNKKTRKDYLAVTQVIKETKLSRIQSDKVVRLIWPLKQYVLTSGFGWRHGRHHDGLDLSAKTGTPIYAAASGKVIFSKRFAGYGNLLVVKHANDYFTAYAHVDRIIVSEGKTVKQGQQIATVGRTGRATGPHLHFEVHKRTETVNPLEILPKDK